MKFLALRAASFPALAGAGLLAALLLSTSSSARPNYVAAVPNGNANNCATCHTNPAGGGARNIFGLDVEGNMPFAGPDDTTWDKIFCADSDGDGLTNGQELGDPCGTWKGGDDDPDGDITNPSDEADTTADVGDCDGDAPPTCELEVAASGCPCSSGTSPDPALTALAFGVLALVRRRSTRMAACKAKNFRRRIS